MSETFEVYSSESSLSTAVSRPERSVILPFLKGEVDHGQSILHEPLPENADILTGTTPLPLIARLCEALTTQKVSYCHWKSNWKLGRWLEGEGDLDLLVERADAQRFASIIYGLGFKQAEPPADRSVPGILNFYGFDGEARKFVHLHVHYQLVVGHDLTKNYHLPIETLCLDLATRRGLMPVAAPELELIVFVIRMVLKYSPLEAGLRKMLARSDRGRNSVELELKQLEAQADRSRVDSLLQKIAPGLGLAFFAACLRSLDSTTPSSKRMAIRWELQRRLKPFARRPQIADAFLKVGRRVVRTFRERIVGRSARKSFVDGGLLIAVVGGDGSGKTTSLDAIDTWLSKKFVIARFHLGKPPRSPFTLATIVILRIRRLITNSPTHPERLVGSDGNPVFPGYVQLLRWLSAGRDRCRVYLRARRFATNGGIALCDRFPLPQLRLMEGPNIARTVVPARRNRLVKRLLIAERNYYDRIAQPDLLIVLRVDPEVAVKRKTTESEQHVRVRSSEMWEQNWEGTNAYVIDANQPAKDVLAEVQSIIWAKL